MEEEKISDRFACEKCQASSSRLVYKDAKRLCPGCANEQMPRFAGMHEYRITKAKHGINMTYAECERIKATRSNPDGTGRIINPRWR